MQLITSELTQGEHREIQRLLDLSPNSSIEIADLWKMMDIVWDEMECDNNNLDFEKMSNYYSHPIWTLNGLFIEQDDVSMKHREAIAGWIADKQIGSVLDYGGGFGTLARLIATKRKNITVDIHEPFPSQLATSRLTEHSNIKFVDAINNNYECLVCIDVLEHVPNPLELFEEMIKSVKIGGFVVIANCFYPEIKCHLPSTFHFRHTFNLFANAMGLQVIGRCAGSHAVIYRRISEKSLNRRMINQLEKLSKLTFPINEIFSFNLSFLKKVAKGIFGKHIGNLRLRLKGQNY
jgi:2-polyprenyl-3-methyl-5-hydroxy-6-metoxy-1,4-benzoquinol methylase